MGKAYLVQPSYGVGTAVVAIHRGLHRRWNVSLVLQDGIILWPSGSRSGAARCTFLDADHVVWRLVNSNVGHEFFWSRSHGRPVFASDRWVAAEVAGAEANVVSNAAGGVHEATLRTGAVAESVRSRPVMRQVNAAEAGVHEANVVSNAADIPGGVHEATGGAVAVTARSRPEVREVHVPVGVPNGTIRPRDNVHCELVSCCCIECTEH